MSPTVANFRRLQEEAQEEVEDELETCQRQRDMLESQAREAFAKAKVIVAKLERTAIERRKKVRQGVLKKRVTLETCSRKEEDHGEEEGLGE